MSKYAAKLTKVQPRSIHTTCVFTVDNNVELKTGS